MRGTSILVCFFIAQVLCRNVPNSEEAMVEDDATASSKTWHMFAPNAGLLRSNAVHHSPGQKPVKDIRMGDILWRSEYNDYFDNSERLYDAIKNKLGHWPDAEVPYVIAQANSQGRRALDAAIKEFKEKTCIRIKRRTNERDYVRIIAGGGCYSYVGKIGGMQDVSLGRGCEYKSTAVHELMHALGFFHEQSRPDRDNYVIIRSGNMQPGALRQFSKRSKSEVQYFGQKYDYNSVMHYEKTAFSSNGRNTIEAKGNPSKKLGQGPNGGLSAIDVKQLNAMYCGGGVKPGPTTTTTTSPGGGGGSSFMKKVGGMLESLQKFMNKKIDQIEAVVAGKSPKKGDVPILLEKDDLIQEIENDEMKLFKEV